MPPYKFDSSRAWGRHYGQDFSGGGAPLMIVLGTAAIANNAAFSLDSGASWTQCSGLPASGNWRGVAFSPSLGYAIMVSFTGVVMVSTDGIAWSAMPGEDLPANSIFDVIWAENLGLFIACTNGGPAGQRIFTSPTGVNWTIRATPATPAGYDSLFQNPLTGRIFAGAISDSNPGNAQSDDGVTWVAGAIAPAAFQANQWGFFDDGANGYLIATGGTTFAPVPRLALLSTTDNGASWVIRPQNNNGNQGVGILVHPVSGLLINNPSPGGIAIQHGFFHINRNNVAPVPGDWTQSTSDNVGGQMIYSESAGLVMAYVGNGPRIYKSVTGTGSWTDNVYAAGVSGAGKIKELPI